MPGIPVSAISMATHEERPRRDVVQRYERLQSARKALIDLYVSKLTTRFPTLKAACELIAVREEGIHDDYDDGGGGDGDQDDV